MGACEKEMEFNVKIGIARVAVLIAFFPFFFFFFELNSLTASALYLQ